VAGNAKTCLERSCNVNGLNVAQLWLAGAVTGALLLLWPAPSGPQRREAMRWVRYASILACGAYLVSPAFPLTAARVGWPWSLIDDLMVATVLIRCILASAGATATPRPTGQLAQATAAERERASTGGY
jgi:hypothetical protein